MTVKIEVTSSMAIQYATRPPMMCSSSPLNKSKRRKQNQRVKKVKKRNLLHRKRPLKRK